ncbi:MAG: aconitase/3-isopropylmalate dehydratase large subunit family protein [Halobacteria archaeon]
MAPLTITQKILARHLVENGKTPYRNAADGDLPVLKPGTWHEFEVDVTGGSDVTADGAFAAIEGPDFTDFGEAKIRRLINRNKHRVVVALEHFLGPGADVFPRSTQANRVREYARKYGLPHVYDIGVGGICHIVLPEEGHARPGDLILWADSHTPSYGALGAFAAGVGSTEVGMMILSGRLPFKVPSPVSVELTGRFRPYVSSKDAVIHLIGKHYKEGVWRDAAVEYSGEGLSALSLEARITMANMAAEMEATTGIFPPDAAVERFVNEEVGRDPDTDRVAVNGKGGRKSKRARAPYRPALADPGAKYGKRIKLDLSTLEPLVAAPYSPDNYAPVSKVAGTEITKAFLGSCTNARLEDLVIAAEIVAGRKVAPGVLMKVVPASEVVLRQAENMGVLEKFRKAGARVADVSSCSWCLGSFFTSEAYAKKYDAKGEVVQADDVVISASNRNFPNRMGHPEAWIFLASPAVVAASAVAGAIANPADVLEEKDLKRALAKYKRFKRGPGQKFGWELYGGVRNI